MAGECLARLAVHKEPYLLNLRNVGMQRADDGEQRERFYLHARRMLADEAAAQVDYGKFTAG